MLVISAGPEPATFPVGGDCSIPLSYGAGATPSYGSEDGAYQANT